MKLEKTPLDVCIRGVFSLVPMRRKVRGRDEKS